MALFNSALAGLFRERAIIDAFDLDTGDVNTSADCFVTLHSGDQPTANDLDTNWTSYRWPASSFLGGVAVTLQESGSYSISTNPTYTVTANNNGTATWAVLWSTRTAETGGSVTTRSTSSFTSAIPTQQFFVVPVSDYTTSTGIVRMLDTNMVQGSVSTITDVTMIIGQ